MKDILHVTQSPIEAEALRADAQDFFRDLCIQFVCQEAGGQHGVIMLSHCTPALRKEVLRRSTLFVAGWLAGASFGRRNAGH